MLFTAALYCTHPKEEGHALLYLMSSSYLYLCSLSFTWTEIASLLGVLRMTMFRQRQEFGLLSDAELHNIIVLYSSEEHSYTYEKKWL